MLRLRTPGVPFVAALTAAALAAAAIPAIRFDLPAMLLAQDGRVTQQAAVPVLLPVPFGIDQGACDRDALAAELRDGGGALLAAANPAPAGLVGGGLGERMDPADQACIGQALEYGPVTRPVAWTNAESGADYTVTPRRTYQAQDGAYCREYELSALIADRQQEIQGRACRRADGSWRSAD